MMVVIHWEGEVRRIPKRKEEMSMTFEIQWDQRAGDTGKFAASELRQGIAQMCPQAFQADFSPLEGKSIELQLGFPLSAGKDPFWDDGYEIAIKQGAGTLTGSNPRSLLMAVYRLLTEAGCAFLRPTESFYPSVDWSTITVQIKEEAFYRHRGICLEGADSLENVLAMVDWAPKVGYNSYFTQFMEGYTFFERWYCHSQNPYVESEGLTKETCQRFMEQIVQAVKLRGLLYHGVGHGWTCEPLGIPGLSWKPVEDSLTPEQTKHMALVNGKRGLWKGIPLNTNLCYGNPETRQLVTDYIASYAERHPEMDVVHFWLADDCNNQCECPLCQTAPPSDFYVEMLNELDAKLQRKGLNTKIVFLLYFDLLWPPETRRIQNPHRFLLMFAPITRTFSQPLRPSKQAQPLPPYRRNHLSFPQNVEENLAFLQAWQENFPGDSFDFDYHLISPLMYDLGLAEISSVLYQDIQQLKGIGLNGLIHCQVQRTGIPHNFPGWMAGHVLWDPTRSYEAERHTYFRQAFGEWAPEVEAFLDKVTELFPTEYLSQDHHGLWPLYQDRYKAIRQFLKEHHSLCKRPEIPAPSREALRFHWRLLYRMNNYLVAQTAGDQQAAEKKFHCLKTFLWKNEPKTQPWFDTYVFDDYYSRRR